MQLLDASLAFALTLAALATVVTTILEACLRIMRIRKKNLVEVMKLLNKELEKDSLQMSPEERWLFFSKVVVNPAWSIDLVSNVNWDKRSENSEQVLCEFLSSFDKITARKKLYDKVTLEYVLRCLAECDSVKRAAVETTDKIKTEFNRIARKYEEFGSAVSVSFKQYAHLWSIIVGIFLALAANVDGLRIFEAYLADPKLATAVIEEHEAFLEKNEEVQKLITNLKTLHSMETAKISEIEKAQQAQSGNDIIDSLKRELLEIQEKIADQSKFVNLQKNIQDARAQVAELTTIGVPIGWHLSPNYPDIKKDPFGFFTKLLKVILTGILIGLGAPFWFDVAKRLARIRKGLANTNASDETRLAARDANGNTEERKKIVEDVVLDIANEAGASRTPQPSNFMGPKGLIL